MIKLTWGNLRDNDFMSSLGKLFAQPMGFDLGMRFAILGREVKKQQNIRIETHDGILKKFGTQEKERPGVYTIPDASQASYNEEMKRMDDHSFELRIGKFDALKLSEIVDLLPQDLMLLEPILLPFEIPAGQEAKYDGPRIAKPHQASTDANH